MSCTLRYGTDSLARLDFAEGALVCDCADPPNTPVRDLRSAVADALATPLDYPSLARSTTPGDRVVLSLEAGFSQSGPIASAVIGSMIAAGVHADGISVLRSQADRDAGIGDPRPWLPSEVNDRIHNVVHDPDCRRDLAYLAATREGDAIHLNRALVEADVVVPISCCHGRSTPGYYGLCGAVFPTFSDQRTIRRYRSPSSLDARARPKRAPGKLAAEVGWLLGITLAVQAVPGPGDAILHVVAGEAGAVARRAGSLYAAAWSRSVPRQASLVVAAVEGGSQQQTWQNLARALATAGPLVEEGGAIALACDLQTQPGPALRKLADAEARPEAMRWIRKELPEDALVATLLDHVLRRNKVYLLSRLDESLVEGLEIAPMSRADELRRLVGRFPSCIVLRNAPHAIVEMEDA